MNTLFSKLEYTQIIQLIEKYCKTYIGKELCHGLIPYFKLEHIQNSLLETQEATSLLYKKGVPPFIAIEEMEYSFKLLESGQTLSIKALLNVVHFLELSSSLSSYFYEEPINDSPTLESYFAGLYKNNSLTKNIADKIIDEITLADNASSALFSLRKNKRNLEAQVKDKLTNLVHSSVYAKYLMDPIITIRNNRYVIPVKEEYRDKIKGFIHDTSASGSTLYIEPTNIFELNNQINHLQIEEEIEIQKILQVLSASLFPYVQEFRNTLACIGELDLIFAKAGYGKDQNCIFPNFNNEKYFSFYGARHPLIRKEDVVPIDISIGKGYSCLLITGPNTGGKTVALKTIGLLLLMAYSGIPIPCNENTNICVFSSIFVDIGDEQSIEQSLSTFSSHMMNIISIIKQVDSNSLVLLDEIGSGTDPVEGSALAISILSYLQQIGASICCTTHYPELKEFALITDGFENASFEFDLENLKPTYHLLMGIPGKSNAFEISKRLGLDDNIINYATSLLDKDKVSFEELLKNIYDDQLRIEKEKEETDKNLKQVSTLRKQLEMEHQELQTKKKEILENAKAEARTILLDAKEEASDIIKTLNDAQVNVKQANKIRNKLNEDLKVLNPTNTLFSEADEELKESDLHEGLAVWIPSLQTSGVLLSSHLTKSGEVLLQVGLAKMNMKLKNLSKMPASATKSSKQSGSVHTVSQSKSQFVSSEINVIGQNVEDAIYVIDKYIDNCAMAHLSPIRIVHGKGTGKLREGIHKYLKTNSHVKSFRLGTFGEGEMGVTVVEL